jgi:hypothetical protein
MTSARKILHNKLINKKLNKKSIRLTNNLQGDFSLIMMHLGCIDIFAPIR